jgi:DNA mismatch endonuclease (patch repair protein)
MDRLTKSARSKNMSLVRSKNTTPEILVRKFLFSRGLRFRKNDKRYPGCPDVVLPKYRVMIFVNGCFWHCHANCKKSTIPKTNAEFWENKLSRNKERDTITYEKITEKGWNIIIVWECELVKSHRDKRFDKLYNEILSYLQ